MSETARTVFYDRHVELGAKMVEFAGWEMPIQYPEGIIQEHLATRREAGLFDVSHMGRFIIRGPGALNPCSQNCTAISLTPTISANSNRFSPQVSRIRLITMADSGSSRSARGPLLLPGIRSAIYASSSPRLLSLSPEYQG